MFWGIPCVCSGSTIVKVQGAAVIEAKKWELENLKYNETFEEMEEKIGIKTIGSRWVVKQKEKHYEKKIECKARLVAREF